MLCCCVVLCRAVLYRFLRPALLVMCPTQNLAHTHMYIWVPDVSKVDVANKISDLFREFSDYVTVRRYVCFWGSRRQDGLQHADFCTQQSLGLGLLQQQCSSRVSW